jgi:hypothetical protein
MTLWDEADGLRWDAEPKADEPKADELLDGLVQLGSSPKGLTYFYTLTGSAVRVA